MEQETFREIEILGVINLKRHDVSSYHRGI